MRPYFSSKHIYYTGDTPTGGIIHTYSQGYTAENEEGHLSIKTMWGGNGDYKLGSKKLRVNDAVYSILNYGQPYTLEVSKHVESFCIFLKKELIEEIWQSHTQSLEALLEGSAITPNIDFIEMPFRHDKTVSPLVLQLRNNCLQSPTFEALQQLWFESLPDLALALLRVHQKVNSEVEGLGAARASTRRELYQRLHRAKNYIEDNLDKSLKLETIAQTANLSPYHFQKSFKELFQQTPSQYHNRCRINRAKDLLLYTNESVLDICIRTGFESLSSFSKTFKRHAGTSPSYYRKKITN